MEPLEAYAVLISGLMGMGNKLFAVPWGTFGSATENKLILNAIHCRVLRGEQSLEFAPTRSGGVYTRLGCCAVWRYGPVAGA